MQSALSRLPSWELDHDEEDIRGWILRDDDGRTLGTVGELIVDTNTKSVTEVVLGDGKKFPAHDLFVDEHFLTLARAREPERAARPREPSRSPPEAVAASEVTTADGNLVVPMVVEEIDVVKHHFHVGGVRVDVQVVTKPFDEDTTLREERVHIEQRNVDRALDAPDAEACLRDATAEVAAKAELPVVDKRARVVEEIIVKKEVVERVEHVHDTLRHTDVEVTKLPGTELSIKGAKT